MVSLFSAKQDNYLTVNDSLVEATPSGLSFVFTLGLVLFYMKKPGEVKLKAYLSSKKEMLRNFTLK